jgi:ligand-binding sensor domain-containing protein
VVFATEDKRVLALAVARDGGVWLGTSAGTGIRYDLRRDAGPWPIRGNEVTALVSDLTA